MITKKDRITTGAVDYFPNALAAVGRWSAYNNTKYPPAVPSKDGSPRWSFDVSTEHADAIGSHLAQRGTIDEETGFSHSVPLAWRALALLERELVEAGAKPGLAVIREQTTKEKLKDMIVRTPSGAHVLVSHPAQHLAIEAFKAEQADTIPCPCGDIECTYEPFPDRFDALKGGRDAG